jgi:metal-responsive CopG/Arc/MetJ family transcriptional regulator
MNSITIAARLSATIPQELLSFLDEYQRQHALDSRSAALVKAIEALQERELEQGYVILGQAQRDGLEQYPSDNTDGLIPENQ